MSANSVLGGQLDSLVRDRVICVVCMYPVGGMKEYFEARVAQLKRDGWKCHAITPVDHCEFDGFHIATTSVRRLAFSALTNGKLYRAAVKSIVGVIRKRRPSVILLADSFAYNGMLARDLTRGLPEATTVLTLHDPVSHGDTHSVLAKLVTFLNRQRIKRMQAMDPTNFRIMVHHRKLLKSSIFDEYRNVIVEPHPLPTRKTTRNRPWICELERTDRLEFGFMGRIEDYKGLDVLHAAISLLERQDDRIEDKISISIVGRGSVDHQQWESLRTNVTIRNEFIDEEEFHCRMANLDLLIMPYRSGTQSGVGYLALAYGIPILATDVGAIRDAVVVDGLNGRLVPPSDAKSIAAVLQEIVSDRGMLIEMTRNAASAAASGLLDN